MHLDWRSINIQILQLNMRVRSLKWKSTRVLVTNQGALWDMGKWSIGYMVVPPSPLYMLPLTDNLSINSTTTRILE